jgi:hypothetical protein
LAEDPGQVGQGADVRVAVGRRAEPVRIKVDGLDACREGAGHVVAKAVADVQDGPVRGYAESFQRDPEDGRIRLGHPDHRGVDDHAHPDPGRGNFPGWFLAVQGVADAQAAQLGLHGAV